jgi:hypothetical protein
MVWLGVCSKGVSPLVVFEDGTVDHDRYIKEVLSVALKYSNEMFADEWTFQQDDAKPHIHGKSQGWCTKHVSSLMDSDHWPPNSPDLNPFGYCIRDEVAQAIEWNAVTSKRTLIVEFNRAVEKVQQHVVFESCSSWTNRLYRLPQNKGN